MKAIAYAVITLLICGCSTLPAQRGGVATIGRAVLSPFKAISKKVAPSPEKAQKAPAKPIGLAGNGDVATITQPDNPGQQSTQNYDYTKEDELIFSKETQIVETVNTPDGAISVKTITVPAGSKKVTREVQRVGQTLGASQKDTARADAAWLASFQWVQGLGVLVMLVGAVCFAWAPARALVGKDTAAVIGGCGLILIFGPAILQKYGNYFALALIGAGIYWFVSRAKHKEGQLDALTQKNEAPK